MTKLSKMNQHLSTISSVTNPSAIEEAASIIRRGGLVAFPTETVYGLGADATNAQAVAKVFEVKGRPHFDPLIVHVASVEEAQTLWVSCPHAAHRLMEAFWPGPLTLVLPKTDRIPDLVTAGLPTVAVRMPDHDVAFRLIQLAGCPIAAPSANRFGGVSPTTAQAVREELGESVEFILDGGPTRVGIESTVLGFERERAVLLRPGGVPLEALQRVVRRVTARQTDPTRPASPGMLARHYAPRTPLYLLEDAFVARRFDAPFQVAKGAIGLLALKSVPHAAGLAHVEVLSHTGDLVEAATRFFQALRRLDALSLDVIIAMPVPEHGLGLALMDRLRKASVGKALLADGRLFLFRTKESGS